MIFQRFGYGAHLLRLCFLFMGWISIANGNQNVRDWKLTDGTVFNAEIVTIEEADERVILRLDNGTEARYRISEFSLVDRAWLLEWTELREELEAKVKTLGGRIESREGRGAKFTTGFHIYYPSSAATAATPLPMMVLFDPGAQAKRYLLRHMEAAEQTQIILVACEVFRNNMDETAAKDRFAELFPIIEREVSHDEQRRFLGGTSGGGQRAFDLTTDVPNLKWAGIYSNGGWLGGPENSRRAYPALRVAMVNGNNDRAANFWVESDSKILGEKGCTISVISFEGAHQIPPPSVQAKAFKWLLGQIK